MFVDADKGSYPEYLEWALRLSRPGSLILGDNAIRGGSVLDLEDESTRRPAISTRRLPEILDSRRLSCP